MNNFNDLSQKLKHILFIFSSFHGLLSSLLEILLFQLNPFCLELVYFITLSSLGFLTLKATKPRTSILIPNDIDIFFTSVSASTVFGMPTLEMEFFSNTQLVFLTVFMFVGGEVFTSMLGLHLMRAKKEKIFLSDYSNDTSIELGTARVEQSGTKQETEGVIISTEDVEEARKLKLKLESIKNLAYLVSCYLLVVHAAGTASISIYLSFIPSAKKVLETKGIKLSTFSIFTTVSTFSNCGFVPTNENMVVFRKNSGLLLILIPQILMGNTMYPVFLRLSIWFMEKMTKREEFRYMLRNSRELGYRHLIPGLNCVYLGITGLGFIVVQLVVFCSLEWNSEAIGSGLSSYEKLVGFVFQVVNSRHAGESVFDLSTVSQAILVMVVLMMYLPPYTSYIPIFEQAEDTPTRKKKGFLEHILFSQLTYLLIFIFLICITERHKMKRDPLNFNVLNIVVQVISAYGNVGFTVGYSCQRQIYPDVHCKDAWYGFAGKWSDEGKILLIVVMFVGRLKTFNKRGGRAWSLA